MEQKKNPRTERTDRPSASFLTGVVALVFLVIGYQTALFVHQAAVARIASGRDRPDTVYVRHRKRTPAHLRRLFPAAARRWRKAAGLPPAP